MTAGNERLDALNREIVTRVRKGGEAFLSNAVIGGRFHLRACITNFRTREADVRALPEIVVRVGREVKEGMARASQAVVSRSGDASVDVRIRSCTGPPVNRSRMATSVKGCRKSFV